MVGFFVKKFWVALLLCIVDYNHHGLMGGLLVRAEEESILTGAQVNEQYLWKPDWYPGNELIGPGF